MISCTYRDRIGRKVELEVFEDKGKRVYAPRDQGGEGRPWVEGEYVFKGRCRLTDCGLYGFVGHVSRITFEHDRTDAIRGMGEMVLHALSKLRLEELTEPDRTCTSSYHHGRHWGKCFICGGWSGSPRKVPR